MTQATTAPAPNEPLYRRAVYTFSSAHFLNDLCTTGLVPALIVMYKEALNLSFTESSLIVLISYLTSSISQPFFGMLTDRTPRVWLFTAGVFCTIGGLAMTGAATSFGWLLIFVAISGFGSGAFHPEASRGTHLASGTHKGLAQAIFQVGGNAGQAFGPLMIPLLLIHTGLRGLLWLIPIAFLSLLLTAPMLGWMKEKVADAASKKKEIRGRNNIPGAILLISVIVLRSWCQLGVVVFLPFYMTHLSLAASETLNFVFVGAGALGTFIGGIFSDRIGLKRLMIGSMLVATPFALLLPHLHGVWTVLILLVFGFSVLASFSVTVVYMQRLLPRNIALASGLSIGAGVGAGGIGSVFMGSVADVFGVATVFTILSLLPLAGALISFFLPDDRTQAV
ncbi:MFS transporter [Aciduricibacillus chroicocephali]|uniref:MFS transporter n=1 Tax=Aciduricibacillus chroicocephali TaxID=3054939 RepID=A0ABY9KUV6_9BACI|nr:MFS transporter [Bacillaceae bacterium 44XB]